MDSITIAIRGMELTNFNSSAFRSIVNYGTSTPPFPFLLFRVMALLPWLIPFSVIKLFPSIKPRPYFSSAFITITPLAERKSRPNGSTSSGGASGRLPSRFSAPIGLAWPAPPISCPGSGSESSPRSPPAGSGPQSRSPTSPPARNRTAARCCWARAPLAWEASGLNPQSLRETRSAEKGFCSRSSVSRTL